MMFKTFANFQILIDGIYEWGRGYVIENGEKQWLECCKKIKAADISGFKTAALHEGVELAISRTEPTFIGERFYCYAHPMEIAGDCQSCPNCLTENEGHYYGNKIKDDLEKVVAVIKECFPQATAKIRVKCYKVNVDSPTYEVKA